VRSGGYRGRDLISSLVYTHLDKQLTRGPHLGDFAKIGFEPRVTAAARVLLGLVLHGNASLELEIWALGLDAEHGSLPFFRPC
jgi:hypothetical protein